MDRNPYASPSTSPGEIRRVPLESLPSEPELGVIDVVEQASMPPRAWRLAMSREALWLFVPGETSAFVFSHEDVATHGNVFRWGSFVALTLNGLVPDGRAIAFKIDAPAVDAFRRWMRERRELHVGSALAKRLRFSLPLGIFVAVTALPILTSTLDPFALVFGAGIAALAVIGRRAPHASLFAIDGALWLSLGAGHAIHAYRGSTFSLVFAIVCVLIARQSFRTFAFYR